MPCCFHLYVLLLVLNVDFTRHGPTECPNASLCFIQNVDFCFCIVTVYRGCVGLTKVCVEGESGVSEVMEVGHVHGSARFSCIFCIILLCFTLTMDLGHISDSLEAGFSILDQEIAAYKYSGTPSSLRCITVSVTSKQRNQDF
jgi:hypothetical protein